MNRGESLDNDVKLGELLAEIRHKIDRLESEVSENDCKWQMLIDKVAAMRNAANQESDSELVKALATIEGYIAMLDIKDNGNVTEIQAFNILLQTLHVDLDDEPPKFEVNEDGEIVCDYDDRGELCLALYHLATKICPNTEFRHLFDDPNTLMSELYKRSEEVQLVKGS